MKRMIGCNFGADGRAFARIGGRVGASKTVGRPVNGREFLLRRGGSESRRLRRQVRRRFALKRDLNRRKTAAACPTSPLVGNTAVFAIRRETRNETDCRLTNRAMFFQSRAGRTSGRCVATVEVALERETPSLWTPEASACDVVRLRKEVWNIFRSAGGSRMRRGLVIFESGGPGGTNTATDKCLQ